MSQNTTILRTAALNLINTFLPVIFLIISLIISIGTGIKNLTDTFMLWLLLVVYVEGTLRSVFELCLEDWEGQQLLIIWGALGTSVTSPMIINSLVSPNEWLTNPTVVWLIYLIGLIYGISVRMIAIVKEKSTYQPTSRWFNYVSCYFFGLIIIRLW